jgi:ABC-2 type transport system permease protein
MTARLHVLGLGLRRGLIVYRHVTFSPEGTFNILFWYGLPIAAMVWLRNEVMPGGNLALGTFVMPGLLGLVIAVAAVNPAFYLAAEREDGTLLRAKAVPNGLAGYIAGLLIFSSVDAMVGLVAITAAGLLLLPGLEVGGVGDWLMFVVVSVLGLLAVLPLGIVIGSVVRNPRTVGGLSLLAIGALLATSGISTPLSELPGWLQPISQALPAYWLGLGMRSVLLPDAASALEIGQSWRTMEMLLVLVAYAVIGSVVAQAVLRRMARRESGSAVEARRQQAMQRV